MRKPVLKVLAAAALTVVLCAPAAAQDAPASATPTPTQTPPAPPASEAAPTLPEAAPVTTTACGVPVAAPASLPPAGSGPVLWVWELCFDKQGNVPSVEPQTYQYYIKLLPSRPTQGIWVPWDATAERTIVDDFKALWDTKFLDDLSIEANDFTFPNGVVGKIVTYRMEERERVKIVSYSNALERTKIDDALRERAIELRLDSFLDEGVLRRVDGVLRDMMAEKGFPNAEVTHTITPVAGGPKLINVAFNINEGPKIKIRRIDFMGNQAISDGTLRRKMKENRPKNFLSFILGSGTYKETKFEEDAQRLVDFYRQEGYVRARVGNPELRTLEDEKDGKTRWVELRIPVSEGARYRVGSFTFEGNTVVKGEGLRPLFRVQSGEWYNEKRVRDGLKKAQEVYGGGGYMEFTGYPDLKLSDEAQAADAALAAQVPAALADVAAAETSTAAPTADVTMRLTEGKQYFVNRIIFTGNTTTRDNVVRREMRLLEGGVFNTEALKFSVRRINQLGYFKPLEGSEKDVKVDKTPGRENTVDVTVQVEEQNRNQLTFGAGVSQYEGVFGQLAFQTSNFMGRGESLTLSLQAGERAQNYQLAFTEPFLFDRNITGGFDLFKRTLQYIGYYTQQSSGANLVFGFPVASFSRMFMNYSFEQVRMTDLNEALIDTSCLSRETGCSIISSLRDLNQLTPQQLEAVRRNPFVYDSLLIGQGGRRTISKAVPSFVHNTVDNPIFPSVGKRLTASVDLAVLGGNTQFYKPRLEGIWFLRHTNRTSFGFRSQFEYIKPVGTSTLPIFERLYLGGEYTIRGYDVRSVGPTVPGSQVVLGGNKSVLFNFEYLISIAGPVRLILFYDAGQVRDVGQKFGWNEDLTRLVQPPVPLLFDPFATVALNDPAFDSGATEVYGRTSAFKTSTGAEVRFMMPVLNVPFRLIFASNPQRGGVLDNNLQPAKKYTFKFAVGSTF